MKLKLLSLLVICSSTFSCSGDPVINRLPVQDGGGEETVPVERDENTILSGSFNIRYYNTADTYSWAMRREAVMKFVNTEKPDFLAMYDARTQSPFTEPSQNTFNNFTESGVSIVDHIFYGGNISPEQYDVVTEDYGVRFISDHWPVLFLCSYK